MKILVITHSDLIPPEKSIRDQSKDIRYESWITEFDVISHLDKMGHEVRTLGVYSELAVIREAVNSFKPKLVFNLLEEFDGNVLFDQHIVSFLELLKIKYTGCGPRGLMLSRDKALAKKILTYHRIPNAKFQVFSRKKKVKINSKLNYPVIVKCLYEDASLGLSNASVVNSAEKAIERVQYLHKKYETEVIVEEFIEGKEVYVGIVGNSRLDVLPILELKFNNVDEPEKEIYSEKAKWSKQYREKKGVDVAKASLDSVLEKKIINVAKKAYIRLGLNGIARIDMRVSENGIPFVIEANPNPNLAIDDEIAKAWSLSGRKYTELLKKLINLSKNR